MCQTNTLYTSNLHNVMSLIIHFKFTQYYVTYISIKHKIKHIKINQPINCSSLWSRMDYRGEHIEAETLISSYFWLYVRGKMYCDAHEIGCKSVGLNKVDLRELSQ